MTVLASLPTAIDYAAPVPPLRALPTSRARWSLDPTRAAVLVHDLQRYFTRVYAPDGALLRAALDAAGRVLAAARATGVPVYYTAQTGDQDPAERGLQGDLWGPGMSARPEDTAIRPEVEPAPGETVLVKHRYSAFTRSDLATRLAAAGRDQLVLVGVYAHIGITATAFDAFQREVHPFVVADAVADLGPEQHARALDQVAGCCGVVTTADDVVDALRPTQPADALLRRALRATLAADAVARAFADPDGDLFALGLSSLSAFELLDDLADVGVDVDFGEFTRRPSVRHLRERARSARAR